MRRERLGLYILSFSSFLYATVIGMVVTIVPIFSTKVGASQAELGVIVAGYGATFVLCSLLIGRASDHFGRRNVLICGMLGYMISLLFFTLVTKPSDLALIRFFEGIVDVPFWVVPMALIADAYPPEELGRSLGILFASQYAGMSVGPVIAGVLLELLSFPLPFYICTLIVLISIIVVLIAFQRKLFDHRTFPRYSQTLSVRFPRQVILSCIGLAVSSMCYGVVVSQLILYAIHLLGRELMIGALVTGYHMINAIVQVPMGRLSDIVWKRSIVVMSSFAVLGLAFFSVAATTGVSTLIAATLLIGACEGAIAIALTTSIMDAAPSKMRGLYSGFPNVSWGVGYFLGPLIAGFLAMRSAETAFMFAGAIALAMVPMGRIRLTTAKIVESSAGVG